jgi:hypothetical protein
VSTFSKEVPQSEAVTSFSGAKAAPASLCALATALGLSAPYQNMDKYMAKE